MLSSGIIDPVNRTFDILGVNESATNISVIGGTLRLSYTSPEGKLVQLIKPLGNDKNINIGDAIGVSKVTENGVGGFALKTNLRPVARSLAAVNWNNTAHLTTKTFQDENGMNRTAVLLPVVLQS